VGSNADSFGKLERFGILGNMKRSASKKRRVIAVVMIAAAGFSFGKFFFERVNADEEPLEQPATVSFAVSDEGREVRIEAMTNETIASALERSGMAISSGDTVFPSGETRVSEGLSVSLRRAKTVTLSVGGEERSVETTAGGVGSLLAETGTKLGEDDFAIPSTDALLEDGMEVDVVRVVIEEEVVHESIPFETVETEDDDLGWRVRKVVTPGEKGEKELAYRVVSHNGEEIKRTLVDTAVVKEPVTEEVVQGTYVKLGKKHTGYGTWYAHTGTLAAASPWLPMGSYAKVTNAANGKSVIVVINDRGPSGENRIIDLDKVAFEKIASLGAGVIEVKVEEVEN